MTNAERMINHIQLRLAQKQYTVLNWELSMLDKMLKALPSYEEDKAYDIICGEDEAPEIEDSVMYRTFDSSEFHVGDEITDGDKTAILLSDGTNLLYYLRADGIVSYYPQSDNVWKRTGRNFPAIENILNILKKSEVNNA
jgi:hypothetical protein